MDIKTAVDHLHSLVIKNNMEKKTAKILLGVFATVAVGGLAWWGVNAYKKGKSDPASTPEKDDDTPMNRSTADYAAKTKAAQAAVIGKSAYAKALLDTTSGAYTGLKVYRTAKVYTETSPRTVIREVNKDQFVGTIVGEVNIGGYDYYKLATAGTFGTGGVVLKASVYTK